MPKNFMHWYRVLKIGPPTIAILTVTVKVAAVMTLHMDGFSTKISFGYQVKKGISNKVFDMISRPIVNSSVILKHNSVLHESYIEQYAYKNDFRDVYASLSQGKQIEELDYHVHNSLLYHLGKLCIPHRERNNIIRDAHTSFTAGHFGVGKIVVNIQRYCYWPCMFDNVSHFIRGCYLCKTSNPNNRVL